MGAILAAKLPPNLRGGSGGASLAKTKELVVLDLPTVKLPVPMLLPQGRGQSAAVVAPRPNSQKPNYSRLEAIKGEP